MDVRSQPANLPHRLQALILHEAIEREFRLLEIVTAQEREQGNRDGWALARIKVRELRSVCSKVVTCIPWTSEDRYGLKPEDRAELAERIAEIGLRMKPPRAEMEMKRSVKARRKSLVKAKAPNPTGNASK
ncbi:hypothetical protein [Methylobacterium sp. Leaf465]|uniref:hypothetical protein n=1 Tax=Methylobacterium sp. Leaf465 TaxID=1736385 RepID=UPI000AAC249D|nr:hypothetical protein [Methylobacterium sp. Leaf465]